MSAANLEDMRASHEALLRALDDNDLESIEAAVAAFGASVDRVRSAGGWRADPEAALRAAELQGLFDAAQRRVNILTDNVRGRLDRLSAARGEAAPAVYGRARR